MKKRLGIVLSSIALMLVLVFTLCACSSYGGIKSAFEDAGYEEVEISEEQKSMLEKTFGESYDSKVTVHALKKDLLHYAVVVEFKDTDDMIETLKDDLGLTDDDIEAANEKLQQSDLVNENCYILPLLSSAEALKIFKDAK